MWVYFQSNLLPDEQIVYAARLHWKFFSFRSSLPEWDWFGCDQPIVAPRSFARFRAPVIRAFIQYKSSEFAVTTKRVIIKVGFLLLRRLELLRRQVEPASANCVQTQFMVRPGSPRTVWFIESDYLSVRPEASKGSERGWTRSVIAFNGLAAIRVRDSCSSGSHGHASRTHSRNVATRR